MTHFDCKNWKHLFCTCFVVKNFVYFGDFLNSEQVGKLVEIHRFYKGNGIDALNCDKTNSFGRKISRLYQVAKDHVVRPCKSWKHWYHSSFLKCPVYFDS